MTAENSTCSSFYGFAKLSARICCATDYTTDRLHVHSLHDVILGFNPLIRFKLAHKSVSVQKYHLKSNKILLTLLKALCWTIDHIGQCSDKLIANNRGSTSHNNKRANYVIKSVNRSAKDLFQYYFILGSLKLTARLVSGFRHYFPIFSDYRYLIHSAALKIIIFTFNSAARSQVERSYLEIVSRPLLPL